MKGERNVSENSASPGGVSYVALGLAVGLVLGGIVGLVIGNMILFAGGGLVLGLAIGYALDHRIRANNA
jgi:hypothetical protein